MTEIEAVDLLRHMERWGYDLTEPPHPRSPGYNRLIVAMRRRPTEEHYDPEAIHLHLCGAQGTPVRTTVHRDTTVSQPANICPGRLELSDRVNARRGFFTYGATIDRGSTPDETVIDIRSPAPILELTGTLDETIAEQLVSETEAQWAKTRAQWGADDIGFTRSLASKPPQNLYASTVLSLWEAYQHSRILRQTFPQFYAMLRRELEWAKKLEGTQAALQPLDEMMRPRASNN